MKPSGKNKQQLGVFQSAPITVRHNAMEVHLGTNSLLVLLTLGICLYVAKGRNVLDPNYLKGMDHDLLFAMGLCSVALGVGFYEFWNLGKRSIYSFHIMLSRLLPSEMIELFTFRDYAFAIAHHSKYNQLELPAFLRKIGCIIIMVLLTAITVDNRAFNKVKLLPETLFASAGDFCPETPKDEMEAAPEPGCELVIRAFELGYSKDLGSCAPKLISPEQLSVCDKRRADEPYLHYASRLLFDASDKVIHFFSGNEIQKVEKKFELQWQQVENLRDYQLYAMSAAPRASHHIWTNLPSPNSDFQQAVIDVFQPNYCLDNFQKQTNTVSVNLEDERSRGKMLEHVYGQLLFNPKVKRSVGLCKEYQIHWEADENVCDRLAQEPAQVLTEYQVLAEVEMVLKRHDIAQAITDLDEKLAQLDEGEQNQKQSTEEAEDKKPVAKNLIDKSKIAKNKRFREKNEIVSFHCFMRSEDKKAKSQEQQFEFNDSEFTVRSYPFHALNTVGESQIAMYKNFAKALDKEFHYTQLSSRSGLELQAAVPEADNLDDTNKDTQADVGTQGEVLSNTQAKTKPATVLQDEYLANHAYMLARLEILNNIDIFLGNDWVLEREDLLEVYPFHVHLQNYVESFRIEYQQDHGRL